MLVHPPVGAQLVVLLALLGIAEDLGINLAGVQRLLSIAEIVQRIRPMARGDGMSRGQSRRLSAEIERLLALLGL